MEHNSPPATINRIGFIGNYLPRQCGIAPYYGAADTSITLATGSVSTMLKWLEQHG